MPPRKADGETGGMTIPDKVREKLRDLPDKPGCYMMRDRRGTVIYVGKAKSLRKRVQWYFRDATLRGTNPKIRGLVKSIEDIDLITVRNEAEAVLTEGRLIKEFKPRYNVSFRDDKRFLMLRGTVQDPFPVFRLCRVQREDGAVYFGPYASAASIRAALNFVEREFGLRRCTPRIPDGDTYQHCLNDVIRFCSAPCIGKVDSETYRARFKDACAFLRGERPAVLTRLAELMQEAAEKRDYERAAALRDTLTVLRKTVRTRARMAPTPEMRAQDAQGGIEALKEALGLHRVPSVMECYDISNISGTYSVASMVCAVNGMPNRTRYRRFRIKTITGTDDPGMMAEVIHRRFSRLLAEAQPPPGLVIVDGGLTQLRAARAALDALGLQDLRCIGLAKRFEEIYTDDGQVPLRLPRESAALRVLQQLRDEAHRFAITYHRHLRNRRIKESVLDDVPGIGSKRKALILAHFGSVERLRKAGLHDLLAVPGIGREMAALIMDAVKKDT